MSAETVMALRVPGHCPFDVTITNRSDGATVAVAGGLDGPSSLVLEDVVGWLCRDRRPHITIDGTGLSAVHCTAIAALSRATAAAHAAGGSVTLTGSTALARRLIELAQLNPTPRAARQSDAVIPRPRQPEPALAGVRLNIVS
jgi:anti-anti-sigma regulatory factor